MLGITRIVAFDDKQEHLDALVRGIGGVGEACIGYRFANGSTTSDIAEAPHVRVVFFDLNMVDSLATDDFTQHYSTIGYLLSRIKPIGPYFLVLWTIHPDRVDELREFLDERLADVAKPFDVVNLPKERYIDDSGLIVSETEFISAIQDLINQSPALAALSDWEAQAFSAASTTLSSVTMLGDYAKTSQQQQNDIPRLIKAMALASAGTANLTSNLSRAVGDALVPVLADHVSSSLSQCDDEAAWEAVFNAGSGVASINANEAAQLNAAIHLAYDFGANQGAERGSVIALSEAMPDLIFEDVFGIDELHAADKQFRCRDYDADSDQFSWVLVQAQAACDYAQGQPGPLPFYLGLDGPEDSMFSRRQDPAALWRSSTFEIRGQIRLLMINARFHMSLSAEKVRNIIPLYRLREQILADFTHLVHSYASRPGKISFEV